MISVRQVDAYCLVAEALESGYGVPLRVELQIEMPAAVLGADGRALLAPLLTAAGGGLRRLPERAAGR